MADTKSSAARLDHIEDLPELSAHLLAEHTQALSGQRETLERPLTAATARSLAIDEQTQLRLQAMAESITALIQCTDQRLRWLEARDDAFTQMFVTPATNGKRGKPPK